MMALPLPEACNLLKTSTPSSKVCDVLHHLVHDTRKAMSGPT